MGLMRCLFRVTARTSVPASNGAVRALSGRTDGEGGMPAWWAYGVVALVLAFGGPAASRTPPARSPETAAIRTTPPLPPPRPDRPAPPNGEPDAIAPRPRGAAAPPAPSDASADQAETEACRERLGRLGVRFEVQPPLQQGVCGTSAPLLVTRLSEDLEVAPAATMTCPVAEALARWAVDVLKPESDRHFKDNLGKILIGTSYECRDQRSGGKLSEHAFANGVDVMGFAFSARPDLAVGDHGDGSPEAEFQKAVRTGACTYFTTVLGPGSDEAHADHLHLDMRIRNRGYRICQ